LSLFFYALILNFFGFFALNSSGDENLSMIASNTLSTFSHVLPETQIISSLGIPITFSISVETLSGFAAGKSILLSTGMISNH
jgi:hypothetical protein